MNEIFDIGAEIALRKILASRLLIQGAPGSGKSYAVRKLAETFSGAIQQIIFDPEGEFVTLREKYPFALVAREGGDIPLNVDHAPILAETILRTKLSVIIDLYDLKQSERLKFVGDFFKTLMVQPKEEWHDVLTYVDEAQLFCPEGKVTYTSDQIIDYATRGRKRGFGLIMATLRLALLDKGVAAMLASKMVGLTTMDIDVARAAFDLGMTKKEIKQKGISALPPGHFFAMGPAFNSLTMFEFRVAPVSTTHLEPGQNAIYRDAIPAPDAIRGILDSLKDLPAEADQRLETEEQMRKEIARLRLEAAQNESWLIRHDALLTQFQEYQRTHTGPAKGALTVMAKYKEEAEKAYEKLRYEAEHEIARGDHYRKTISHLTARVYHRERLLLILQHYLPRFMDRLKELDFNAADSIYGEDIAETFKEFPQLEQTKYPMQDIDPIGLEQQARIWNERHKNGGSMIVVSPSEPPETPEWVNGMDKAIMEAVPAASKSYNKCEKAILALLVRYANYSFTHWQIAFLTNYSETSGSFGQAMGRLKRDDLIDRGPGDRWMSSPRTKLPVIRGIIGHERPFNQTKTVDFADDVLDNCSSRILALLSANPNTVYERRQIAEQLGYSENSGSFGQSISYLMRLELIIKYREGYTMHDDFTPKTGKAL